MPPRILRFRLPLSRFSYSIHHVPDKLLYTSDTLSRTPVSIVDEHSKVFQQEAKIFAVADIYYKLTSWDTAIGSLQIY